MGGKTEKGRQRELSGGRGTSWKLPEFEGTGSQCTKLIINKSLGLKDSEDE